MRVNKGRAHRFGLEEFADHVAHARQQQALEEVLVIRPRQTVGDFRDCRRGRQEIWVNKAGRSLPERDPPRIIRRVASGEPRDVLLRLFNAVPEQKSVSLRQWQKPPRVNLINLKSVFPQFEIFDDFRLKQVAQI